MGSGIDGQCQRHTKCGDHRIHNMNAKSTRHLRTHAQEPHAVQDDGGLPGSNQRPCDSLDGSYASRHVLAQFRHQDLN